MGAGASAGAGAGAGMGAAQFECDDSRIHCIGPSRVLHVVCDGFNGNTVQGQVCAYLLKISAAANRFAGTRPTVKLSCGRL